MKIKLELIKYENLKSLGISKASTLRIRREVETRKVTSRWGP